MADKIFVKQSGDLTTQITKAEGNVLIFLFNYVHDTFLSNPLLPRTSFARHASQHHHRNEATLVLYKHTRNKCFALISRISEATVRISGDACSTLSPSLNKNHSYFRSEESRWPGAGTNE